MTTRDEDIAAVTMLLADGPCLVRDDPDTRSEPCPMLDHPNLDVDALCRLCRWRWGVLAPTRAAITRALDAEQERTLEAVGCETSHNSRPGGRPCDRCRMLSEVRERMVDAEST